MKKHAEFNELQTKLWREKKHTNSPHHLKGTHTRRALTNPYVGRTNWWHCARARVSSAARRAVIGLRDRSVGRRTANSSSNSSASKAKPICEKYHIHLTLKICHTHTCPLSDKPGSLALRRISTTTTALQTDTAFGNPAAGRCDFTPLSLRTRFGQAACDKTAEFCRGGEFRSCRSANAYQSPQTTTTTLA